MKKIKLIGLITALSAGLAQADIDLPPVPAADSGLVTVFSGQTAQINVVNLDTDPTHSCSFTAWFIDATGASVPATPLVISVDGGGGASSSGPVPFLADSLVRAHLDFTQQLLDNPTATDPMLGCYRLAPTLEVFGGTDQKVFSSNFFGLPVAGKGIAPMKIAICHHAGPRKVFTQVVPTAAWGGHQHHGDTLGACPP